MQSDGGGPRINRSSDSTCQGRSHGSVWTIRMWRGVLPSCFRGDTQSELVAKKPPPRCCSVATFVEGRAAQGLLSGEVALVPRVGGPGAGDEDNVALVRLSKSSLSTALMRARTKPPPYTTHKASYVGQHSGRTDFLNRKMENVEINSI